MARLAKCSRQKFFRPIIATFRAPLDFEPVIILSCLIPLFFIVRAQKILSLSLFLFSFLLFLSSFFSDIYIYKTSRRKSYRSKKFNLSLLTRPKIDERYTRWYLFTREKSHLFQHPRVDRPGKKT